VKEVWEGPSKSEQDLPAGWRWPVGRAGAKVLLRLGGLFVNTHPGIVHETNNLMPFVRLRSAKLEKTYQHQQAQLLSPTALPTPHQDHAPPAQPRGAISSKPVDWTSMSDGHKWRWGKLHQSGGGYGRGLVFGLILIDPHPPPLTIPKRGAPWVVVGSSWRRRRAVLSFGAIGVEMGK
jgi:hypothetical protein